MFLVTLTPAQWDTLHKIQRQYLRNVVNALDDLGSDLQTKVQVLIRRMHKGGWSIRLFRSEIRALMTRYGDRVSSVALALVNDAAKTVQTYQKRLLAYDVADMQPLKPAFVRSALKESGPATRVALAYVKGRTAGAKRPFKGKLALSKQIHTLTDLETKEITRRVVRAIRESQSLQFASRELVAATSPEALGKGLPRAKIIRKVESSLSRAQKLTGGSQSLISGDLKRLRRYLGRLKEGGTMQTAYRETIDKLTKGGKIAEKATETYAYWRQRYLAERIIETETATAYRTYQADFAKGKPWIVGYRWNLNKGVHAAYARRAGKVRKPRKIGRGKGARRAMARCICEVMSGQIISPQEYKENWLAGGHPFCQCWFEEIFSESQMLGTPPSAEEKAWLSESGLL